MADMTPLERMQLVRQQAESAEMARENYARFLAFQRDENGWTAEEYADYKAKIGVLMGRDDAAALALFPDGAYQTAEEARQGARVFWQSWCDLMLPKTILRTS
jgi:hypothetical protein